MYKNFNITESEKEQILNRLKENGYGQPINEQNAPDKKPVTSQQSVDNVPQPGQRFSGTVDQNIVKNLNIVKELVGAYLNNIEVFVPKTIKTGGVVINNGFTLEGVTRFHPRDNYEITILIPVLKNIGPMYIQSGRIVIKLFPAWNNTFYKEDSIVAKLTNSKDVNEFYQNLNRYKPEVYAKQEHMYGQKELGITVSLDEGSTYESFHFYGGLLKGTKNPLNALKIIETVFPNVKKDVLSSYEMEISKSERKREEGGANYFKGERQEFMDFINQTPEAPTQQQPVQGQPAQPQKPLNEGQEILKDVFKSLLK